jgi:hypothetical protein
MQFTIAVFFIFYGCLVFGQTSKLPPDHHFLIIIDQATINIKHQGTVAAYNFPIRVQVNTAELIQKDLIRDCADIEIVDLNEKFVPFYVENECPSASTFLWLQLPTFLPADEINLNVRFTNSSNSRILLPQEIFNQFGISNKFTLWKKDAADV